MYWAIKQLSYVFLDCCRCSWIRPKEYLYYLRLETARTCAYSIPPLSASLLSLFTPSACRFVYPASDRSILIRSPLPRTPPLLRGRERRREGKKRNNKQQKKEYTELTWPCFHSLHGIIFHDAFYPRHFFSVYDEELFTLFDSCAGVQKSSLPVE